MSLEEFFGRENKGVIALNTSQMTRQAYIWAKMSLEEFAIEPKLLK